MNTTNHSIETGSVAEESEHLLKTDVIGRTLICRAQRQAINYTFEASGMKWEAFTLQHGTKILTFTS
jgi:hypothetical protein